MALGANYATLSDLKGRLGISDSVDDTRLSSGLDTASKEIELFCHRQFNDAGSASARIFYTASKLLVVTDDFFTTTGLVIEHVDVDINGTETATTLLSTEYRLEPLNGVMDGYPGWPYFRIRNVRSTGFPKQPELTGDPSSHGYVRVTARWGWSAVPAAIKEATLIMAEEFFKLKEAPFGVANWGEFGPMRVQDNKRAKSLLLKYRRGGFQVE